MSLTSAMYTGVSGLLANSDAMNVIGNNISNVNTVGYKAGRSVFSDLLSETIGNDSQVGRGVELQTVQNLFTQGTSQNSENVTDVSIQGTGFFALSNSGAALTDPAEAFLTRAGAFHVDESGYLVNPDGYKVLDEDGGLIQFDDSLNFVKITAISTTGKITYLKEDGTTADYDKSLAVVNVPDASALQKIGGSLFKGDATTITTDTFDPANGKSDQVRSNTLEQSNVDLATEFVRMIVTQRAYSANSKTITTTDAMTQEVLNLIR